MIIIKMKTISRILFFLVVLLCAGLSYHFYRPRVKIGDHYIILNPKAKINPKRQYKLTLWDYNWPVKNGSEDYRFFLQKAVGRFQTLYPNIDVEIKLLDILSGHEEMAQALKTGELPDV